jgi:hypothetical protein
VERKAHTLSVGARTAVVLIASSTRFGGNWGFIRRSRPDFVQQVKALLVERPNVQAVHLANGALILGNEHFLFKTVNSAVPGGINNNFMGLMAERRKTEQEKYLRFLKEAVLGQSKTVRQGNGYTEITVGLYCLNDNNVIRVNGIDYPSFRLTLPEALDFSKVLHRVASKVMVRVVMDDGSSTFEDLKYLMNNKALRAMYRGLDISPSDSGAFMTFRIVR